MTVSRLLLPVLLLLAGLLTPASGTSSDLHFTILHTNDEHSHLLPFPLSGELQENEHQSAHGGMARLAALAGRIRSEREQQGVQTILVSAGDFMGGAPFGWLAVSGHAPELLLMQKAGYDVITPGNHEFDHGPELLAGYLRAAGESTAIVASNTHPPDDHPLAASGMVPYHMIRLDNGLTLGFLGLLGNSAQGVAPFTDPVRFSDPFTTASGIADTLRQRGADVVIAVTHSGVEEDIELARKVPGIDLIVGGHSHTILEQPLFVDQTPIVQAGENLQFLGRIDLAYSRESESLRVLNDENSTPFLHPLDHSITPDPDMERAIAAWTDTLNQKLNFWSDGRFTDIRQTLACSGFDLERTPAAGENPLGNLVSDAMRHETSGLDGINTDVAFQASGSLRSAMYHGRHPPHQDQILFYDAVSAIGLGSGRDDRPGYPLIRIYLTGEELRRVLEISILTSELLGSSYYLQASGLRMRYDRDRAIMLQIPFTGTPVPTYRAVLEAWHLSGNRVVRNRDRDDEQHARWIPLERGDEQLYSVVTDHYVAAFLPRVGEIVPQLMITPKDAYGNPFDPADAFILKPDGNEFKMWEAVAGYLLKLSDDQGCIPDYYRTTGERLITVSAPPVWFRPLLIALLVLIASAAAGIGTWRLIKRRRSPE